MMLSPLKRYVISQRDAIVCAVFLAAALLASGAFGQSVSDGNLIIKPYLDGLSSPTGVRFSAPGEGFVIEKNSGKVLRFANGSLSTALDLNVQGDSERGLLGIALDPQFSSNRYVYLYYSTTSANQDSQTNGNWVDNRLVRYRWNGSSLVSTGLSRTFGSAADLQGTGPNHNGGPLTFGADGTLYGATGDLNRLRTEQNISTSPAGGSANVGGIYRLNTDLTAPTDNPFTGGFSPWYAYGVRNSFGVAVDPLTGNLWDTENGPDSYDEINLVTKGSNSGWRAIMGPDARDPQTVADLVALPGSAYSDPELSFNEPIGITSIEFLAGSSWGNDYVDKVLVGGSNFTNDGRL